MKVLNILYCWVVKKILGIILVLSFFLIGNAYTKIKIIEEQRSNDVAYSTVCVDGYKFMAMFEQGNDTESVSITQFYILDEKGNSVPAKC